MITQLLKMLRPPEAHLTVSVGFDNKYVDYGKILLRSIRQNSPRVRIVVLAINLTEADFKEFSGWENLRIIYENREFEHPYEQRLYSMARRIFLINELRHDPAVENLLQLDADLMIRKDLNGFKKLFEQGEFCILARPEMRYEFLRLTMSVVGLANTGAMRKLTQEWVTQLWHLLEAPQESKYVDQLTLWKAYEKVNQEQEIKLVNLSHPFIGSEGNTIVRVFAATKNAKGNQKLLKELSQFAGQELKETPNNAPSQSEQGDVFLKRELLLEHFKKAGLSD